MRGILEKIKKTGIIPVVTIDDAACALPLAKALIDGGIPCAEVTFRTAEGEKALKIIKEAYPDIILGAGTVLTPEQAKKAKDAGASFAVSPGFNPKVVDWCLANDLPIIPGCITPTEMERAIERGFEAVKFFPAEQAGGVNFIKAVSEPYPMLNFVATGGIGPHNLEDYLSFPKVIACGGSWLVKPELLNAGRYDEITRLCKEAVEGIRI
ncbi:MAG: bifunctional 4-hydroxy-2-oxoglutarate aldolase/2-dehydro-3-deoxy-phosphogluconate aldolase [Oscillospiraceae bacterium]|nr:bifunctional 4-hydroxy-2-oxoglutarate aldolase/2-dehydro-3-deoxy-phosphogluconate aldolase [Oscillospiraceae bacterium]